MIVKPHGRSETAFDGIGALRRKLRRHVDGRPADDLTDMAPFAESHPELVVAQWVSAIDKIARKPKSGKKPTSEQRRLREMLGRAAFDLLERERLLDLSGKRDALERQWRRKIHPYGAGDDDKTHGREKGRWYVRFAGGREPGAIDDEAAEEIVRKVRDHLHGAQYRIGGARPDKRQGLIAARAESIAAGAAVLPDGFSGGDSLWSDRDKGDYAAAGDVAYAIRDAAAKRDADVRKGNGKRRSAFALRDAAPVLFAQYGRLFRDGGGSVLPIAGACAARPGLFALHGAVKDAYTRILKKHRKESVARVLPADMGALFRLVEKKADNRDLAALLRLGKAIHYAATPPLGADAPGNAVDDWPADVSRSRYRTSEGQSEIKRNEAFVRVWRNTVTLAARTAKDWADPHGQARDILMKAKQAVGERFDADAYRAKLPLLFGDRAGLFESESDDAFRRSVLRLALEGWAGLRHSSFHFKGRGGFVRALKSGFEGVDDRAVSAARALLARDTEERHARLVETLRAAHVEHYFGQAKLDALVAAVLAGGPPQAPLPRFRRVLDRAEKAWRSKPFLLRLPPPGNRAALEKPGRLCRYTVVKALYERAFPAWLEERDHAALNAWIKRAAARATEAARKINEDEHAVARAAGLISLGEGDGIAKFVDRLAGETATELRVQRGYGSDSEQARKQAKYIDDLRCDVVGQAFEAWLKEAGLAWALDDLGDGPLPEAKPGALEAAPGPASESSGEAEDWEGVLYFLLHLVPVDAVNRLQHQLRKWTVLEGKPSAEAEAVGRLFDLYIAMHDAKFEGGEGTAGAKALEPLFESADVFSRACPAQPGEGAGRYVPWRGLREILRFGDLRPLMPIFEKHPITAREVDELAAFENGADGDSTIARQQRERERLHEEWTKKKKAFPADDKRAYRAALKEVVRHRRLAAHVRLVDHARLHRLLMAVLGRLVDYAGLWERDLYFATLALVQLRGTTPRVVFDGTGLELLMDGRIVEALRELEKSQDGDGRAIFHRLEKLFGSGFLNGKKGVVRVRNNLTHFNMLKGDAAPLDLTTLVGDARRLMAYDRKLKNAVSKSVIELMAREGLVLAWKMEAHRLSGATVAPRQAVHLEDRKIREDLHGERFVAMAADLFAGEARKPEGDVATARRVGGEETGARKRRKPGKKRRWRPGSRRRNG